MYACMNVCSVRVEGSELRVEGLELKVGSLEFRAQKLRGQGVA